MWTGIKNQSARGYITMNIYFYKTPIGHKDVSTKDIIIDAFAAKRIDRVDQTELIKALCYEIVKKLPNVVRVVREEEISDKPPTGTPESDLSDTPPAKTLADDSFVPDANQK